MLRRELIMVEPYRQLRYHGHRSRVASASAVVDSGPPLRPRHVVDPGRRQAERRQLQWCHLDADIRLMRALADIMNSKRLDNDNTDFGKYRRLLQGSRIRSVDRSPPTSPPLEPFPTTDDRGKPLRICQVAAGRPRSYSSPSPSPLDQWPDDWLLRHRHQKEQQQQQQEKQQLQGKRRRRRRRGAQPRPAANSGRHVLIPPRGRVSSRSAESDTESDGADQDADESDASDSEDGLLESGEDGVGPGQVRSQATDPRSDPEVRDRLRRHGMVLMKGRTGCQCKARKIT